MLIKDMFKDFTAKFSGLAREYHDEMRQRDLNCYRVIEFSESENKVLFQIVGKPVILKMAPYDLMCADFLLGFSKADIAVITYLGTKKELEKKQDNTEPKFFARIAQQIFGTGGKTKFMLKVPEQEQLVEVIPEEAITNQEFLNMLEGKEAALIGYAAAENRMIEIRKKMYPAATCQIIGQDLTNSKVIYLDTERDAKHVLSVTDIFYNKTLLALFSKLDQQMISFAAGSEHQKVISPKKEISLKIVSYLVDQLEYKDLDNVIVKTSFTELAFNSKLLDQFNQTDRDMIVFAAGEISKEREMALRSAKN